MNGKPLLKQKDLPRKLKKKGPRKLTQELDAVYSKYIRQKYSTDGINVECYTCYQLKPIKSMQCGHFVSRKELAVRWDERNTRPQCWGCNSKYLGDGMKPVFAERLTKEYGAGIVEELYRLARTLTKDIPYEEKIAHYKALIN